MEIKYDIIKSGRKTVGISVKDGKVIVRAPQRLSKKEIERIVLKHREWITKKLSESKGENESELSEEDKKLLRCIAERYLPARLEYFFRLTGLFPERMRISSAKSRFGSCSAKGSISLSYYVMLYPREAIDLVIVHELCHLRHMNHSKEFYGLLSEHLPDQRERKKLLSRDHRMTMEEIRAKYGDMNGEK